MADYDPLNEYQFKMIHIARSLNCLLPDLGDKQEQLKHKLKLMDLLESELKDARIELTKLIKKD